MPPTPPVANLIRCQVDFLVGTDAAAMTRFHMTYLGGPPLAADMNNFAAVLNVTCAADLPAVMHPDTSYEGVILTDLSSPTGAVGTAGTPAVGVRVGDALPANAAVLANYHISRRYRGGKPRGYWPLGTSADLLTRQTWQAASIGNFDSAIVDIITGLSGIVEGGTTILLPASVSYYQSFTPVTNVITGRTRDVPKFRVGAPVVDIITSTGINAHVSSQRRRDLIRS